ncbi:MAG: malto-oligosyltrehalose synthase, partial [Dehalococcoidia bacterium]
DQDFLNSLIEVTACLPVYRTYTESFGVSARDRRYIEEAVAEAQQRVTETEREALGFLRQILLLDLKSNDSEVKKNEWLSWLIRWQQFTGAIMAKGLEDTALYSYNPLISLNDVGSKPISVDSPVEFFHHFNLIRLSDWPHTMNATSTHDTKRSEDVRARLNILSEIPATWNESLIKWSILNDPKKESVDGNVVPDLAMETLIYQTLIGAWPLMENEVLSFWERFKDYCLKAARESKTYTSWISPNNLYESALIRFIEEILDDSEQCEFLKDFRELQRYVAYYGAINSLSQLLLKITSPGIPDFYQGTETWNFSLVDPDNRRPVRYHRNMQMLSELKRRETNEVNTLVRELLSTWEDGRVKLFIIYKALNTRQAYQDLFSDGDYIPHQAYGERTDHVCAFSRRRADCWALVATPRLVTKVVSVDQLPVGQDVWGDDYLMLPDNAPRDWKNIFTEEHIQLTSKDICLPVSLAFNVFPVALLMSQPK